jgi:phage head maturation protease
MFATQQPFAERWARRGRYRRLPEWAAKAAEPEAAQPAASAPANTGTPGKRTPAERARLAALARWGKYKGKGGKPGKGRKPAATPEEKEAQRRQAAQEARAKVATEMGISPEDQASIDALAMGKPPGDTDALVKAGIVELGKDGTPRLTAAGRQFYNAAGRGDAGAAGDALSRGKDKVTPDAKEPAADEKPKAGGGGGGGGGKEKPTPDEKRAEQDAARAKTADDTAGKVGLRDVAALRAAITEGGAESRELRALGLIDDAGDATDQGRRAMTALERGNVGSYRAAVQDAKTRLAREAAAAQRKADKDAKEDEPAPKRTRRTTERRGTTVVTTRETKAADTYTPPAAARNNARRGLALRAKWGRGGTAVGVARARDLSNGRDLPYRTVARMSAFNRHRGYALDGRKEPDGGPSAAYIAWLLWGGTSGVDWARGITGAEETKAMQSDEDAAIKQTASERAMFANMGSSGGGGGGKGGKGGKPSGGQGGLWKVNPNTGQRDPEMGLEKGAKPSAGQSKPGSFQTGDKVRVNLTPSGRAYQDATFVRMKNGQMIVRPEGARPDAAVDLRSARPERVVRRPDATPKADNPMAMKPPTQPGARQAVTRDPARAKDAMTRIRALDKEAQRRRREAAIADADAARMERTNPAGAQALRRSAEANRARARDLEIHTDRHRAQQDLEAAGYFQNGDRMVPMPGSRATKGTDMDNPYADILDTLVDAAEALDADAAIKAGARNSRADQALVQAIYETACDLCDLAVALGAEEDDEMDDEDEGEGDEEDDTEDEMDDGAVKSLGDGRVGGYAVRFGDASEPDLSAFRDYFTKSTDFWLDHWSTRPMLYHHAQDEATKAAPVVGTWTSATVDSVGVWLEGQLNKAHQYHGAIKELVRRGALKLSSDSAPHLVVRERQMNGAHEIKRWPLLAASLTPTPAEPRLMAIDYIKALYTEAGIDLPPVEIDDDSPEASEPEAVEVADATKTAAANRARRLSLELDLLLLETL